MVKTVQIKDPGSIKVAREIMERFTRWVDDSVASYEEIPFNQLANQQRADALIFAKRNLIRIINDVTEV